MKSKSVIVIIMTLLIHVLLDAFYRPFIYEMGIFDFYFANSFSNLTSVILISAIMVFTDAKLLYGNKFTESLIIVCPVLAMVGYEFIQPWIAWTTFDPMDIIYSFIGGIVIVLLKKYVYNRANLH
jgi:hypothetical protein